MKSRSRRERERERESFDLSIAGGGSGVSGGGGGSSSRCGVCGVDLSSIGPMEGMVTLGGSTVGDGDGLIASGLVGTSGEKAAGRRFHSSCLNLVLHRCPPILLDALQ